MNKTISKQMKDYIDFQERVWPILEVTIFQDTPDEREVLVGTTDLEERLVAALYHCDEAYRLDESICYYIRPEEIDLPEDEVVKIVEDSYK